MNYVPDGNNYLVRLEKGDRLMESLQQFVEQTGLRGAWVNGIGGALEAELGFYDLDKKAYEYRRFEDLHEIVSLSGSLAFDESGKLVVHLHGVLGGREYQTVGGHVRDLTAAATIELFVQASQKPLKRTMDPAAGLPLFDFSKEVE